MKQAMLSIVTQDIIIVKMIAIVLDIKSVAPTLAENSNVFRASMKSI